LVVGIDAGSVEVWAHLPTSSPPPLTLAEMEAIEYNLNLVRYKIPIRKRLPDDDSIYYYDFDVEGYYDYNYDYDEPVA